MQSRLFVTVPPFDGFFVRSWQYTAGPMRLAVCGLTLGVVFWFGCRSGPPTLPPPPPAEPPTTMNLDPETVVRGQTATPTGLDTERQEGRIRAAVLHRRDDIQDCYERVLPAAPDTAGRVEIRFVVETSGLVSDAQGETTVPALRPTRECILQIIRPMRIEGVTHAARVTLPFVFENPTLTVSANELVLYPRMRFDASESIATMIHAGSGPLSETEVTAVVTQQSRGLLGCYTPLVSARATRRSEGFARYELHVGNDGVVTEATQADIAPAIATVGECLQNVLRALRFRATNRHTTVTVPLVLRPQEHPTPPPRQPRPSRSPRSSQAR